MSEAHLEHVELQYDDPQPTGELKRRSSVHTGPPRQLAFQDGVLTTKLTKILDKKNQIRDVPFPSNKITSAKYNNFTFVPLNLMVQFARPANFYFLFIAILQSNMLTIVKDISTTAGLPMILFPLTFVIVATMIKDFLEDKKRKEADKAENTKRYQVHRPSSSGSKGEMDFRELESLDIKVGDVVLVNDEQTFPADLLLLRVANPAAGGHCYVETSNLDGETNLKIKQTCECYSHLESKEDYLNFTGSFELDPPSPELDAFSGRATYSIGTEKAEGPFALDNILMRGTRLKNSEFIYGLVAYTGGDSKIIQNATSKTTKIKRSSVENLMNKCIAVMFALQLAGCLLMAIGTGAWLASGARQSETVDTGSWYLRIGGSNAGLSAFLRFFTWIINMAGFVPISLLVTLDMVKFLQAKFMQWDKNMYRLMPDGTDKFCDVLTSSLNEELGQVEYVFSDKTGTLTCNCLDFRKCIIGDQAYGTGETEISKAARKRLYMSQGRDPEDVEREIAEAEKDKNKVVLPHINFDEEKRIRHMLDLSEKNRKAGISGDALDAKGKHAELVRKYFTVLALCNTCFPQVNEADEVGMKASSPDDEALVTFSNFFGIQYYDVSPPNITLRIKLPGHEEYKETYKMLALLDFTSKRKRMSVLVETPEGKIMLCMKGADSSVAPLLDGGYGDESNLAPGWQKKLCQVQPVYRSICKTLDVFAEQGLRTLLVSCSVMPREWWYDPENGYKKKYEDVMRELAVEGPEEKGHFKGSCGDRCRRCEIEQTLEIAAKSQLVGATAIEDKLQDGVPKTVASMLNGGIKVWVLTGDKLQTAINIGMACSLLEPEMEAKGALFQITAEQPQDVLAEIQKYTERWNKELRNKGVDAGLVITSKAFSCVQRGLPGDRDKLRRNFLRLATVCKSVVACRLQPDQKAQMVKMVRDDQKVTCLSVGDGANDEPMIRLADVGVGIAGVEGTAAVRASDFAIGQFSFLGRLLFVWGRNNYIRVSFLTGYMIFKNAVLAMTVLLFGFSSGYSGEPYMVDWANQAFNVVFTAFMIILFAIWEEDITDTTLMANPGIYRLTRKGRLFNRRIFARWIGEMFLFSLICYVIPLWSYGDLTSADGTGNQADLWSMGLTIYTCVIVVVNMRLLIFMRTWTKIHATVLFLTLISFPIWISLLSSNPFSKILTNAGIDYNGLYFKVLGQGRHWFACILTITVATLPMLFYRGWHEVLFPDLTAQYRFFDHKKGGIPEMDESGRNSEQVLIPPSPSNLLELEAVPVSPKIKGSASPPDISPIQTETLDADEWAIMERQFSKRRDYGFDYSHTAGQGLTYMGGPRRSDTEPRRGGRTFGGGFTSQILAGVGEHKSVTHATTM